MKPKITSTAGLFVLLAGGAVGFYVLFVVLTAVLRLAPEPIGSRADLLIEGAQTTMLLTLVAGVVGLFVGVLVGLTKLNKNWIVRAPADLFIWVVRGTPLLVQILFCYYALPALLPQLQFSEFSASVIALSMNVGAYNAEVIRAGIQAVAKGQREAAQSLGLSRAQTMWHIILPQALRIVVPPLVNNIVALLKDSSLAYTIGLLELSLAGNRISSETFMPVPVLTSIALIYLVLTTAITTFTHFLERRMRTA